VTAGCDARLGETNGARRGRRGLGGPSIFLGRKAGICKVSGGNFRPETLFPFSNIVNNKLRL